MGCEAFKIASPELNHTALLREVASYRRPIILSSGVSRLADIEEALGIVGREDTTILHCVTAYPAPEEEYNVGLVATLGDVLGVETGISDHSRDPALVPGLATACGARVVEKHICLARDEKGLDDAFALEPDQFAYMVATIRRVEKAIAMDPDEGAGKVMDEFGKSYGFERVDAVLGDGIKRLAPSEEGNYGRSNRSLHITRDMGRGEIIGRDDLAILRTEQLLSPGAHPRYADLVIGATLQRDLRAGDGLRLEDVIAGT